MILKRLAILSFVVALVFRNGTAASYPWTEPYISFTRDLLRRAESVVFHNGGFDQAQT